MTLNGNDPCQNEPLAGTDYCGQHGEWFHADLEVFREINEHFRMDVREYWSRSNFYLLVQGALVSVFVGIDRDKATLSALPIFVGSFGLLLSIFWIRVARASVGWINTWRDMTVFIDKRIDRHACYRIEETPNRAPTAEEATSRLPWLFALGWVVLLGLELA